LRGKWHTGAPIILPTYEVAPRDADDS
jgi:hypothetical protein